MLNDQHSIMGTVHAHWRSDELPRDILEEAEQEGVIDREILNLIDREKRRLRAVSRTGEIYFNYEMSRIEIAAELGWHGENPPHASSEHFKEMISNEMLLQLTRLFQHASSVSSTFKIRH